MIITLTGPNTFLIHQAVMAIINEFVQQHGIHSVRHIAGEDLEPNQLGDILQGATLFSSEQLVIIKNASQNKIVWEALGEWLDRVPADTSLVLVEPAVDKRTKTYKLLTKLSDFREYIEPSERELVTWLQTLATDLGGIIDQATAHYLMQQVGTDQWRLWHELQKLVHYNETITTESINTLVDPAPQANAFELLDAALGCRVEPMRSQLQKTQATEDPYKFFGLLVSQVHTLALVVYAGAKNADAIAKEAGMHPFVVRKIAALAKHITAWELKNIITAIAKLDDQLKSTGAEPWILLEQCLNKIATRSLEK